MEKEKGTKETSVAAIRRGLRQTADKEKAESLKRFFKTGAGEYGEGDIFIGVNVPEIRKIAEKNKGLAAEKVLELLRSAVHEERML
ncbi:MAG: DNA alkylation repair protein, partial [Candidatus Omnitrophota bacterium]